MAPLGSTTSTSRTQRYEQASQVWIAARWNLCLGHDGLEGSAEVEQRVGRAEPFGSHSIGKERHHEVSAHLRRHQELEHPQRAC
jgi:hypothetical protein